MSKCENCIIPNLLKFNISFMREKLDDVELLRKDLKEAYLYILAVKEYNQNDYGRGDLITKARQYLHLEV